MHRSAPLLTAICLGLVTGVSLGDSLPRSVTVDGAGEISAAPDRATVRMAVEHRAGGLAAARQNVNDVTQGFLDYCDKLGIDDRHVRTTSQNIRPLYRYDRRPDGRQGERTFEGYLVQRHLEVELEDIELIGRLIEGAVNVGVNEVYPPTLSSSRHRELRREALAAAAKDARKNAEALAASMGTEIGAIIAINGAERMPGPVMVRQGLAMAESVSVPDAAATYRVGEITITANVSATFELLAD